MVIGLVGFGLQPRTMRDSGYRNLLVQTIASGSNHSNRRSVRPLPGQGVDDMAVECSNRMRDEHPLGTIFEIRAKVTDREGSQPFLYTHYSWPYRVVSAAEARGLVRGKKEAPQVRPKAKGYVLIIHEVADYPAWKKVFDGAASLRKKAGERSYQVLCYPDDPNRIVHFSHWSSHRAAKRFFESPKLVRIRAKAGVKAPQFVYLDELESGDL